jgi:hypothetical protein
MGISRVIGILISGCCDVTSGSWTGELIMESRNRKREIEIEKERDKDRQADRQTDRQTDLIVLKYQHT